LRVLFFSFPEKVTYSFADFCGKKDSSVFQAIRVMRLRQEMQPDRVTGTKNAQFFREKPAPEAPARGM
jgi:hypothetical protein